MMRPLMLLLFIGLVGCPGTGPGPKPPPVIVDTDLCGAAENNLIKLECKDSRGRLLGGPNLHGESFKQTCETAQESGFLWLNPHCLSTLNDCAKVNDCANVSQ